MTAATSLRTAGLIRTAGVVTTPLAVSARGWYSVTRAAQLLGYSRATVVRMINSGALVAHRIGSGDFRISRALVDAIIEPSAKALDDERQKAKTRVIRRNPK